MEWTRRPNMSIVAVIMDMFLERVHALDTSRRPDAAACLRRAERLPVRCTQTGGRQVEANLIELGRGGCLASIAKVDV